MISSVEVFNYIDTNIYHSQPFQSASDEDKSRAFHQSRNTLLDFIAEEKLTIRDYAEQVVFTFMLDSTFQRAELGVNFLTVDGVQMTIQNRERTLAKGVMRRHNITSTNKRKVARYHTDLEHTFRFGNGG